MCLNAKPINAAVLGDCRRYPLWIESLKRCINYWLKIMKMPNHHVKKCYFMLKTLDNHGRNNWVSNIRYILCSNGFGYVWATQRVNNEKTFVATFLRRLKDQYMQNWRETVNNSSKLSFYKNVKISYEHERYLNAVSIRKFRHFKNC